jgi:hypothetical protein
MCSRSCVPVVTYAVCAFFLRHAFYSTVLYRIVVIVFFCGKIVVVVNINRNHGSDATILLFFKDQSEMTVTLVLDGTTCLFPSKSFFEGLWMKREVQSPLTSQNALI